MATVARPTPGVWPRTKKVLDRYLAGLIRAVSQPVPAAEQELDGASRQSTCVPPLNEQMLPEAFMQIFREPVRLPRHVVYRLHNAHVSWHGVVVKGWRVFAPSLTYPRFETEFSGLFLFRQFRSQPVAPALQGKVGLVFDQWTPRNYYHWLVDGLPRLLLLRQTHPDCTLLLPGPAVPEYIRTTAAALGFTQLYPITPGVMLRVAELYVPGHTGVYGLQDRAVLSAARDAVLTHLRLPVALPNSPATSGRRVYVSRNRQPHRHLINETELLPVLQRYGFETVYFEDMSFPAQVQLMQETEVLLGIHGANLTNSLFLRPGSTVVELMSETYINPCYFYLANSLGLRYAAVPSTLGSPPEVEYSYADIVTSAALLEQTLHRVCPLP